MSAKSKSTLPATPNAKTSPATPRVSITRGVAKPSLQNGRNSIDRSPGSVTPKPKMDKLSPKPSTPTDSQKKTRILKPSSELQAELNQAQEDLKKANEKLVVIENEKAKALDELREVNEKLKEAFLAQKQAEENSEIEKFRALEMEQVGIEATHVKEDEWVKELEAAKSQHTLDVAALLSATQELQKVKQELAMTSAAKNQALSHADDATKIAEIHAENAEVLSAEIVRLKAALEARVEMQAHESSKLVSDFKLEVDSLKQELEKVKIIEDKLADKEAALEKLNVDLEASKMAECYAHNLVKELHQRAEELKFEGQQVRESEKVASESLAAVMEKLKGSNDQLHDAESEIAALKEKLSLMEISSERQKGDLEESENLLKQAKEEASEMMKKVESMESELEITTKERSEALSNEKLAAANLQSLLEEKNKVVNELEILREGEEKSKKALESLASALDEASCEARDAKEKLISSQAEHDNYERQIEDLKLDLKSSNEKYESMLGEANKQINTLSDSVEQLKHDCGLLKAELEEKELALVSSMRKSEEETSNKENKIRELITSVEESKRDYDNLMVQMEQQELELMNTLKKSKEENHLMENEQTMLIKSLEQLKVDYDNLKAELEQKDLDMMHSVKKSEEENSHMENEINRLLNLLQLTEEESSATRDERDRWNKSFKEADLEAIYLKQVLGEVKEEEARLKEVLTEMENQLHKILAENEDLRRRETASQEKAEELSKSLEEALSKKEEEDGDLTDCEKDYDMLPQVVEFSEQNGRGDSRPTPELHSEHKELLIEEKPAESNPLASEVEKLKGESNTEAAEVDPKMWESCKIDAKDFSPERETEHEESFEDDLDSKGEGADLYDHTNGVSSTENHGNNESPPLKSGSQKKKKALLQKFGSLLKKKSSSSHK